MAEVGSLPDCPDIPRRLQPKAQNKRMVHLESSAATLALQPIAGPMRFPVVIHLAFNIAGPTRPRDTHKEATSFRPLALYS